VQLNADEVRAYYEQNKARFCIPEERRESHILVKTGPDARQKAEALLAKVQADPSQFAALAKESSDDPGSAAQGGDLGFFAREMMVKPFAEAAFAMKEGEIRGPVETEFGQHIIRVTEIKAGAQKPFDEARAEIVREVQLQQAAQKYAEAAEQFTNTVYEQSDSLKPAAEKFGLTIETADEVRRQPEPGAAPGSPSAAVKSRPRTGLMPSMPKPSTVIEAPSTRSGTSPPEKIIVRLWVAVKPSKVRLCARRSRKSGGESS
jgi:peptidyl-prolyl cis-trans isomerase D